MTPTEIKTATF